MKKLMLILALFLSFVLTACSSATNVAKEVLDENSQTNATLRNAADSAKESVGDFLSSCVGDCPEAQTVTNTPQDSTDASSVEQQPVVEPIKVTAKSLCNGVEPLTLSNRTVSFVSVEVDAVIISINGIQQDPIPAGWSGWLGEVFVTNVGGGCVQVSGK